jgi:hypothetical protein
MENWKPNLNFPHFWGNCQILTFISLSIARGCPEVKICLAVACRMPTAIFIDIEGDNGVFVKIFGVIKSLQDRFKPN